MTPARREDFYEAEADERSELDSDIRQLVRRALFLNAFSKFEYSLRILCNIAFSEKLSERHPKERFKMQTARALLKKAGVKDADFSEDWRVMDTFRKMRNLCTTLMDEYRRPLMTRTRYSMKKRTRTTTTCVSTLRHSTMSHSMD